MSDVESAKKRFATLLAEARVPTGGLPASVLEADAGPVLQSLAELQADLRSGTDLESFAFREVFTLSTLFGRQLALVDLTPTAMLRVAELLLASFEPDAQGRHAFAEHFRAAVAEGFVRGREERVTQASEDRAARAIRPLRIDQRTFLLAPSGAHEAERLGEMVDDLGRAMLDADAVVGIVDLTQLAEPSPERARAVFGAEEITRMLGASCVFSGVDPRWRAAAQSARVPLELLHVAPSFERGLAIARALVDGSVRAASPKWRALLDRLRR